MPRFFSVEQLASFTGRTPRAIRFHAEQGWLKAEPKMPGVRGLRFSERNARQWMARHYPTAKLDVEFPRKTTA
jgi:hypothetical protein